MRIRPIYGIVKDVLKEKSHYFRGPVNEGLVGTSIRWERVCHFVDVYGKANHRDG